MDVAYKLEGYIFRRLCPLKLDVAFGRLLFPFLALMFHSAKLLPKQSCIHVRRLPESGWDNRELSLPSSYNETNKQGIIFILNFILSMERRYKGVWNQTTQSGLPTFFLKRSRRLRQRSPLWQQMVCTRRELHHKPRTSQTSKDLQFVQAGSGLTRCRITQVDRKDLFICRRKLNTQR